MNNAEYWRKRFKDIEERANKEAEICIVKSLKLIDEAVIQIDKDINYWIKRFAANNNVTMAEARKMIKNKDLDELGWDINEYIRKGQNNQYTDDWTTQLENASASYHISRLDAAKLQMQKCVELAFENINDNMEKSLTKIYTDTYCRTGYEVQKGINIGFNMAAVDENRLKMILEKPWAADGTNFSERVWGSYRPKLVNALQKSLTEWCIRGEDPKELAKKMSKESGVAKTATNRLIHTEAAQICTRAEMDSYDELGVEKYRILETLDLKTCDTCGDMDSQIFERKDFVAGVTAPPFHPRCRGTTLPEVDDDLLKSGRQRAARDLETGKTIYVDDMSYKEWKEKFVGNAQFTNNSKSGIIKSERYMANGLRRSPEHILTDDEIENIKKDAEEIGIPLEVLKPNEGVQTGFDERTGFIHIKGDILPDTNSIKNRDLLSQRAVLAHEYYGHLKAHPSTFKVGDWRDEFRASYRAAIDTPNLTEQERCMLMIDAYDRAKEAGITVKLNKIARRIIYGYE